MSKNNTQFNFSSQILRLKRTFFFKFYGIIKGEEGIFFFFADRLVCKYTEMTTTTLRKLFMQQWTTCVQAYFSLTTLPPPSFFLGGNEVSCHYIFCGLYIYTLCLFLCVSVFLKYIKSTNITFIVLLCPYLIFFTTLE